ncbi:MAG: hypothetical protein ACI4DO_01095 [Roseburia sp.]
MTTEITGTEIETEIVADTEEPTEIVKEEETQTEEEVIATGHVTQTEGYPMVVEYPSLEDWGEEIGSLRYGDEVNIIEEIKALKDC